MIYRFGTPATPDIDDFTDSQHDHEDAPGGGTLDKDAITASTTDVVLGRATAGAGAMEEIPCTAAGRALIDDADAAAQRTTLGAEPTVAALGTVLYVAKSGDDANDGALTRPYLTIGAAITAASAGDTVWVLDSAEYEENVTCVDDVAVYAPHATIKGTVELKEMRLTVHKVYRESGGGALVQATNPSGYAELYASEVRDGGTGQAIRGTVQAAFLVHANEIYVDGGGVGVADASTGGEHIHVWIGDIYLNSDSATGLQVTNTAQILGNVQHIKELGTRSGTLALDVNGGSMELTCAVVSADTAYDVESGATLNLVTGTLTGTETNDGTANVVTAATVVTPDSTDTLTNKTFDANGTGNSLSNVEAADMTFAGARHMIVTNGAAGTPQEYAITDDFLSWATKDSASAMRTQLNLGTLAVLSSIATSNVAASSKTGSDSDLVTGTAGSEGETAIWNADGDLVTGKCPRKVESVADEGVMSIAMGSGGAWVAIGTSDTRYFLGYAPYTGMPGTTTASGITPTSDGVLTGTTGTNGNVSISASTGTLYIENQSGSTLTIFVVILGMF